MSRLDKLTKRELSDFLKQNNVSGISRLNKDDLVKIVRKVNRRNQNGGQQNSGATSLPSRWYNPNVALANSTTNMKTAYGQANPVSGSCRNLAAFPKSSGQQTGGKKRVTQKGGQQNSGATSLPSRWYNPNVALANSTTNMKTAYGQANPVSGACRNLAAFPKSSGQQTGGKRGKK